MWDAENMVCLEGKLQSRPAFDHEAAGERLYRAEMAVARRSGTDDILPLIMPESIARAAAACWEKRLRVRGEIRSYLRDKRCQPRLQVVCYVRSVHASEDAEAGLNEVCFSGITLGNPVYRVTPLGREICDAKLMITHLSGRTSCVPCIFWSRAARAASYLRPGDRVKITGRFQSRRYEKRLAEDLVVAHMTHEVSVARFEVDRHTLPDGGGGA